MRNGIGLSCEDIQKRLQPFLDDLLAEDEYAAFCGHIGACDKCREYVRSIGALSNQLWKLGRVRVPADFSSTVMYKVAHPAAKRTTPGLSIPPKYILTAAALILLTAGILFGAGYFRDSRHKDARDTLVVKNEVIRTFEPPDKAGGERLLRQLETMAAGIGAAEKGQGAETKEDSAAPEGPAADSSGAGSSRTYPETNRREGGAFTRAETRSEDAGVAGGVLRQGRATQSQAEEMPSLPTSGFGIGSKAVPLHWHFWYAEKDVSAGLRQQFRETAYRLQQELDKKEIIEEKITRLKEEMARLDPDAPYSEAARETLTLQKAEKDTELQESLQRLKAEEETVKHWEAEKQRLEFSLTQGTEEKRQKELRRRAKLIDALNVLSIPLDYQKHDLFIFTVSSEKAAQALEQILFIAAAKDNFRDFTAVIGILPDRENRISIYLEHNETGVLHWHITPVYAGQKSRILEIIRELSNSIEYESEELVICFIPDTGLEKLRGRIQAAGAALTEYGSVKSPEGALSSGPVTISIYFTK